jgi:MobA/MobL family
MKLLSEDFMTITQQQYDEVLRRIEKLEADHEDHERRWDRYARRARRAARRNFHAHVLLTMRKIEGEHFGKKCREWNQKDQLEQWRADWASQVNHSLELAGVEERVDHRSWAAQGIDREPGIHLGPALVEMERRGVETEAGKAHRAILERNAERARTAHELQALGRMGDRDDPQSNEKTSKRTGATADWTDEAGMVAQQRDAMRWVERTHEAQTAAASQQTN